ncbi:MAG TPA: nucleoside triphosphate pyrophosphohydrolase [Chthoniobacterales bacterium]|jgi:tetrapyrrole methylase family protein/MazG family protein|nr:nucleoside triphosphate pyrophosphohydrolase [Chthoniobacterales bacterium]
MSSPLDRLRDIVAQLRSPEGCPWDREQTHQSLKPHLIEECYELIDAIDAGDDRELKEELGDLLLQVVLHSQMAFEEKRFDLDEVATVIADKLVNRHPHVFGETRLPDSAAVLRQWEVIKRAEKQERRSALDGVPKGLPALARAQKVQTKAAQVGFDWNEADGALAKVREELSEVESAPESDLHEEIGDLLFALVNFARKEDLDAEQLLNQATTKFAARFQGMERLAEERSVEFVSLPLAQKDLLWEEAKDAEPHGAAPSPFADAGRRIRFNDA